MIYITKMHHYSHYYFY